jgi:hypothetical protein
MALEDRLRPLLEERARRCLFIVRVSGSPRPTESLKRKAVREVAFTEAELERGQAAARASQIVDYLFYIVYGIIGLEITLDAIGARQSAGFKVQRPMQRDQE